MLTLTDLHAGYNGHSVAHIPGLTLEAGKTCLLRGKSGSGKTTLLHTLSGIQPPVSGKIEILGTEIGALNEAQRDRFRGHHIGIVFQTLHLVKSLSVMENILLGAFVNNRAQDKDRAASLLASAGLEGLQDQPVISLSQGQAQRVAIVRALLASPALILADEPTSSLDDDAAEKIMQLLLSGCAASGSTLVVSSHDARITPHFDRVVAL